MLRVAAIFTLCKKLWTVCTCLNLKRPQNSKYTNNIPFTLRRYSINTLTEDVLGVYIVGHQTFAQKGMSVLLIKILLYRCICDLHDFDIASHFV